MPEKIGQLSNLKKLHLHENKLATLPRQLSKLVNLIDFSIEWFMYTKPANSKVQKNPDVIKSVRDFCQNFHFNPSGLSQSKFELTDDDIANASRQSNQMSMCLEKKQGSFVTFTDFIIQYHKIPH